MNFKLWIEGSLGAKRQLKNRFGDLEDFISYDIEDKNYRTIPSAKQGLWQAYNKAQELNKKNGGTTTVYHMISPNRVKYNLKQILSFLTSKSKQEISVSVEKGVWSTGLVISGEAKLLMYYDTDVNTKLTAKKQLIPQAPLRSTSSHHWDEAVIRLSDVVWDSIYVGDDEDVLYHFKWQEIKNLAREFDLDLRHASDGSWSSPLAQTYQQKEEIEELEKLCYSYNQEIFDLSDRIKKSDLDIEDKQRASDIFAKEFSRDYYMAQEMQSSLDYLKELGQEVERLRAAVDELASMIGHKW